MRPVPERAERLGRGPHRSASFGLLRSERTMMYYWIVPEEIDLTGLGTPRQTLSYDR